MDEAYYSALERVIHEAPMTSANAAGWESYLRYKINRGEVKAEELFWTGFATRLQEFAGQQADGKLTREAVQELFEANAISVQTWVGDGTPDWGFLSPHGEMRYATRVEAMDAYRREKSWVFNQAIVIKEDMAAGQISIHSYADRPTEETIATDDPGTIVATFTRIKETYWKIGQDFFDRAKTEDFARKQIDILESLHPELGPFSFEFSASNDLHLVSKEPEPTVFPARNDLWMDNKGHYYPHSSAAQIVAIQTARKSRDRLCKQLDAPKAFDHERKIIDRKSVHSEWSHAYDGEYPYREILLILGGNAPALDDLNFQNNHWEGINNVVAHIRTTRFRNTLFVEELQSDWGEQLRDEKKTANAPFVGSTQKWLNLALKKMLHEAVMGRYEQVSLINGKQSADRYTMRRSASEIILYFNADRQEFRLTATDSQQLPVAFDLRGNYMLYFPAEQAHKGIERVLGTFLTERLLQQEKISNGDSYSQILRERDMIIGDRGMKEFYDDIVPNTLKKLLKKLDPAIQLEYRHLAETQNEQLSFDVTDTLREKVRAKQALFSFAPIPASQEIADPTASLPQYQKTHEFLVDRLGAHAADLITLTDRLPDGMPLLSEGAHTRDDGQTYINPAHIAPLCDKGGKEILSRDERVLWVAHHELFHRGFTVEGAKTLKDKLVQADSNPFVHALADAITAERMELASPLLPRNRTEAVEEALAEIYAAQRSGRMDALRERYQTYVPDLELPQRYNDWYGKLQQYADSMREILVRLTLRREPRAMTDAQLSDFICRIGDAATRALPQEYGRQDAPAASQTKPSLDLSGCASAREAGKRAWEAIEGNLNRLPEVTEVLGEQGYRLDLRRLRDVPAHPTVMCDAFMRAVSPVAPSVQQKRVQQER